MGMPKENDWILSAPYSDKSLVRNVLQYSLAKDWQMERIGATYSQANIIWEQFKPIIIGLVKDKAQDPKERIEKGGSLVDKGDQLELI